MAKRNDISKEMHVRLSIQAHKRLLHACKERVAVDLGTVPVGRILSELILAHLPAAPDEELARPRPKKKV